MAHQHARKLHHAARAEFTSAQRWTARSRALLLATKRRALIALSSEAPWPAKHGASILEAGRHCRL